MLDALENGILKPGSTLIYDNATVHSGQELIFMLNKLLQAYDIKIIRLPTFSPELNPCELIFAFLKNKIYYHKRMNGLVDINFYIQLTVDHIKKFYKHCVNLI
jgi:transposase